SGHSNAATVIPYDANAVSQLVTATYNGSTWDITGSASGIICAGVSAGVTTNCPASNSQFSITITNGGSAASGDLLNFGLIAASKDSNVQKQLRFGQAASGFNSGRSKVEIASGGGFHAVGVSSAPTLIDWMASGGTYYTFVDSGVFTVQFASFTHMES